MNLPYREIRLSILARCNNMQIGMRSLLFIGLVLISLSVHAQIETGKAYLDSIGTVETLDYKGEKLDYEIGGVNVVGAPDRDRNAIRSIA